MQGRLPARLSVVGLLVDELAADRVVTLLRESWPAGVDAKIVAEASDFERVLTRTAPDVALWELDPPDDRGLAALERVIDVARSTPVVVLVPIADPMMVHRVLDAGAHEYVWKERLDAGGLAGAVRRSIEKRLVDEENHVTRRESVQLRRELDQYVGAMAHDLRAPVRTARLMADRLVVTVRRGDDPNRVVEAMETSLERLELLIDRMLRLGALRDSPARPIEENLASIIDDVRHALADELRSTGASLRCAVDGAVVADPTMIRELLRSLVENSVKYRDPRRPPVISVAVRQAGPVSQLIVSDNGLGVPAEHRARVLRLFERLNTSPEEPGLGFGLAFSQRIVELHHGRLEFVEPVESVGAAVRITLPVDPRRVLPTRLL